MAEKKRWVITAADDQSLNDIKKKAKGLGFVADQVLHEIGCITGVATNDVAARVRSLPSVKDVSPEPSADIGPPDALIS